MTISLRGVVTVLLPGTGSDDDYLRRAFGGPLQQAGAQLICVAPEPKRLIVGYLNALDRALEQSPEGIAVGGVSIGAAVAARWAISHPDRTRAVLAALPPWTGPADDAPAALSARHTAAALRRDGLAATSAAMRASSPPWLAEELSRSWARQWPALPDAMEAAADCRAPSAEEICRLTVPLAVVGAGDDPIHPAQVASDWAEWAPRSAIGEIRLDEFGPHPKRLGAACIAALGRIGD